MSPQHVSIIVLQVRAMERELDNRQELLARLTERLQPLTLTVAKDGAVTDHWASQQRVGCWESDASPPPLQGGTLHVVVLDAELAPVPGGGLNSALVRC